MKIIKIDINNFQYPSGGLTLEEFIADGGKGIVIPKSDSTDEIEMELLEVPINLIRVIPSPNQIAKIPSTTDFVVMIFDRFYGFSKVEFPVLDVISDYDKAEPAYVKLYRRVKE